jgi:uncharacterized protein YbbC (DUF1343 family)
MLLHGRINPIFTQPTMKHVFLLFLFVTFIACHSQTTAFHSATQMQTGAEQTDLYIGNLNEKRVGIIANQTSLIGKTHLVDTLLSLGINITKVFSPEHGFRGEAGAGEHISDGKDPDTGIEVLSLYGKVKKPTPEMLSNLDILVFDIQDVGTRFYTYISTLHYILEAAGENNIDVIILDRPNPNGHIIDGPVLNMKFQSFVGMHPIPILHGLTVGELTQMILGENWIKRKPNVKIISCNGYSHDDVFSLPVRPSPNLPNDLAIALYPSLCWFEGTEVSVGRGTPFPFQIIGFPGCTAGKFNFTPIDIPGVAMDPPFENKNCTGLDLRNSLGPQQRFTQLELKWLITMYQSCPNKKTFFLSSGFFDKLCGNSTVREMVIAGKTEAEIRASWQSELLEYKSMRKKYLLYPDNE